MAAQEVALVRITGQSTSIVSRLQAIRPAPAAERSTTHSSRDTVSLSPTGQLFVTAERSLSELPAVRENVVRRLQDQVAAGGYRVNADSVAAAILGGEAGRDE